jgi:hypothetical protein
MNVLVPGVRQAKVTVVSDPKVSSPVVEVRRTS